MPVPPGVDLMSLTLQSVASAPESIERAQGYPMNGNC